MTKPVIIGPAVSDLSFMPELKWPLVEIQAEKYWLDNPPGLPGGILVSVHSPSQGRDISSLNPKIRKWAVREVLRGFRLVKKYNAFVFVLHPGQFYEYNNPVGIKFENYPYTPEFFWNHPEMRDRAIDAFITSFQEIATEKERENINVILGIENLEYPRFPADLFEIQHIREKLNENGYRFYMVFDIPHFWHSMRIMKEGGRWKLGDISFTDYVEKLLHYFINNIVLVHLAGCNGHLTHEPIYYKSFYDSSELDMHTVAGIIGQLRVPIVMEIHAGQEMLVSSTEALEKILESHGIPCITKL